MWPTSLNWVICLNLKIQKDLYFFSLSETESRFCIYHFSVKLNSSFHWSNWMSLPTQSYQWLGRKGHSLLLYLFITWLTVPGSKLLYFFYIFLLCHFLFFSPVIFLILFFFLLLIFSFVNFRFIYLFIYY